MHFAHDTEHLDIRRWIEIPLNLKTNPNGRNENIETVGLALLGSREWLFNNTIIIHIHRAGTSAFRHLESMNSGWQKQRSANAQNKNVK